jgi:hypothetical protein
MAGKQSWAEKQWWHGTVFDWSGALLCIVLAFALGLLVTPWLLRSRTPHPLLDLYENTNQWCMHWERGTTTLPYVVQSNGVRRLARFEDVVVLPPTARGGLRLRLSDTAIASGTRGLQSVHRPASQADVVCEELTTPMHDTASANRRRFASWILALLAVIPLSLVLGYTRHRLAGKQMRRGQTLRGPELLTACRFNELKRGDGVGF